MKIDTPPTTQNVFMKFDMNGDGFLDITEVRNYPLSRPGVYITTRVRMHKNVAETTEYDIGMRRLINNRIRYRYT